MSNSTWPEGAVEDTIGLVKIGLEAKRVMQFLQAKFPSYAFEYGSVKSFIYRYRRRGNAPPRASKWTPEVSARAIALLREGRSASKTAETLDREFSHHKFRKNAVINHIFSVRKKTGDKTLIFPGGKPVEHDIKSKIVDLVKNTNLSSSQIAAQLGLTKGAVCGLVDRMRKKSGDKTLATKGKSPVWKAQNKVPSKSAAVAKDVTSAVDRRTKWDSEVVRIGPQYQRELKAQRRFAMLNMKDHPHAVHIFDRVEYTHYAGAAMGVAIIKYAQCPWPIWEDGTAFSEQLMCGNPKEEHGHYCKAHMCMAHDVLLPAQFQRRPGFINKWTATLTVLRGRAA